MLRADRMPALLAARRGRLGSTQTGRAAERMAHPKQGAASLRPYKTKPVSRWRKQPARTILAAAA